MLKHYDERTEFPDETDTCAMAQPVAHNPLSHSNLQKPPAANGEQEVRISGWLAGSCAPRKAATTCRPHHAKQHHAEPRHADRTMRSSAMQSCSHGSHSPS